jgi:hypothetical protein
MANYSPFMRDKVLNWLKGTALGTLPTPHAALFDGSSEVTTDIRPAGRLAIAFNAPATGTNGRKIDQTTALDFGAADATTDVDAVIVMSASTSGEQLISLPRTGGVKTFTAGAVVKVNTGTFETAGDLENAVKDSILDYIRGQSAASAPSALYVGLYNGASEVTTTIRSAGRVQLTLGTVASGEVTNSAAVDFGAAAGGATVTAFRVFSQASGNHPITKIVDFAAPITVAAGDEVIFPIGDLKFKID